MSPTMKPLFTVVINSNEIKCYPENIITIIGSNGSGKTTVCQNIHNALRKSYSSIFVKHDNPVSDFLPITVSDYIKLFTRTEVTTSFIKDFWEKSGLEPLSNTLISSLSYGLYKTLLVYCAVLSDPDVFIFDEPVSGLDIEHENLFYQLIKDLRNAKKTVVMTSHNLNFVFSYSDQVYHITREKTCTMQKVNHIEYQNQVPVIHYHE